MPKPWIARQNRRGCFILAAIILIALAALVLIGFNGDPIDVFNSSIPVPN